jgi:uncharacterized membrane protein
MIRRFGFFTMSLLSVLTVVYAAVTYGFGPGGAQLSAETQNNFSSHAFGLGVHIFASAFTLLLGPVQLSSTFRKRWPAAHRLIGRTYLGVGVLVGGIAGLYMSTFAAGGMTAKLGFACLAIAWLVTGYKGYRSARTGNIVEHRRWMIRNYAVSFAAISFRLGLSLALVLALPIDVAYPALTWLCWIINLVVAQRFLPTATAPLR